MDPREALAHDAEQQRQRILSMEAGPELDVLVARMMGHEIHTPQPGGLTWERISDTDWVMLRPYSTEVGAAIQIVAAWHGDFNARRQNGSWFVEFFETSREYRECAETLPLAICRARLMATLEARSR